MKTSYVAAAVLMLSASIANAHFPWLYVDEEAYPRVFFGEGLDDRDYHLPESVQDAKVWQTDIDAPEKLLTMEPHEEEGFMGLEADDPVEPRGRLRMLIEYGVYHGSKLVYSSQCYPSADPATWPTEPTDGLPLQAVLSRGDDGLTAKVLWKGEPLAGVKASLSHEGDVEGASATTNEAGEALFPADQLKDGLLGEGVAAVMLMHTDKDDAGEIDGEAYNSAMHVLTVTFNNDPEGSKTAGEFPALPEAVSSFGGASLDGWLYVYSGHMGTAHDHSRDHLSKHFRRLKIDGGEAWEELAMGPALQGLALVPHEGKLYRVGGLDARNASGEEEDLHSTDTFACYDPASDAWTDLPSLPTGRSSHNAVVLDGTLYVVGGWRLSGDSGGEWQAGALAFDLTDPDATWQELAEPPFKRRALAVGHAGGRVAVMCGMTDEAGLSKQTFFYDPASKEWSEGPEFPGKAFHGFGLAAWNVDGTLYAGGMGGVLYRLDEEANAWETSGKFGLKRFFHQLVPDGEGGLIAIGGASPETGHTATLERVTMGEVAEPVEGETPVEAAHAAAH